MLPLSVQQWVLTSRACQKLLKHAYFWQPRTSLGHAGLPDHGIRLVVWYIAAVAVVWSTVLSERQLWLLAL